MSGKSLRLRERKQRYLRRLRGEKKAVSPVVATLILILIAVAAAAALYLWLVAWQGNITGGIGSPGAQTTVTIGGSTSVYPFDQLAVSQFEQNNSDVAVSDNQGGSGAGMIAVCSGAVDVGATSALQTVSNLQANYGCPQGGNAVPVITTVAYDGVDLITSFANVHGLISMSQDTLLTVYIQASSTPFLGSWTHTVNGAVPISATPLTWEQVPACAANAACAATTEMPATGSTWTVAACASPYGSDICAVTGGAAPSPCAWTVCAGGTGAGTGAGQVLGPDLDGHPQ